MDFAWTLVKLMEKRQKNYTYQDITRIARTQNRWTFMVLFCYGFPNGIISMGTSTIHGIHQEPKKGRKKPSIAAPYCASKIFRVRLCHSDYCTNDRVTTSDLQSGCIFFDFFIIFFVLFFFTLTLLAVRPVIWSMPPQNPGKTRRKRWGFFDISCFLASVSCSPEVVSPPSLTLGPSLLEFTIPVSKGWLSQRLTSG